MAQADRKLNLLDKFRARIEEKSITREEFEPHDRMSGSSCANCESEPAEPTEHSDLFCSEECRAEYEGEESEEGECAE